MRALAFDFSGLYLAHAAGNAISVRAVKEWTEVVQLPEAHSKPVMSLAWGSDAAFLASCGMDKAVKFHAV